MTNSNNMKDNKVIGVDIGGSHITAGLVDINEKKCPGKSLRRRSVNAFGSIEEIISTWATCIKEVSPVQEIGSGIGIAIPGPFNYKEGIALVKDQGKYDVLYQQNVKIRLAHALDISADSISFANDAASYLLGETACGAAKEAASAIGLTLGTGLGSARFHKGMAEDADLWCIPFKESIIEEYISTRWFVRSYHEKTGRIISGVKEMIEQSKDDTILELIFKEFAGNLAAFLGIFIKMDHPEVIVIGGNIAKAHHYFLPTLKIELEKYGCSIPIEISYLGEKATIVGAACNRYFQISDLRHC